MREPPAEVHWRETAYGIIKGMERSGSYGSEALRQGEGERYLNLLGLSDVADHAIPGYPQLQMRDFLEICGDHARPAFFHLEGLDPTSDEYSALQNAMKELVSNIVNGRGQ